MRRGIFPTARRLQTSLHGVQGRPESVSGCPAGGRAVREILPVQVAGGEPDGAGSDLTETALLLSVLTAPRETGTPLADGPGGQQGRNVVVIS